MKTLNEEILRIKSIMGILTEEVTPEQVHQAADKVGMEWDDNEEFMDFSEKITGERHIDDMSSTLREKLIDAIQENESDDETEVKVIPISFTIEWNDRIGEVNQDIVLAMSPNSVGVFSIGNDIEKYSGLSKAGALEYNETPDDAYIYGLVNTMNGGKDIFFWTNGTRLASAADKVGVLPACFEQLTHEGIHLTRAILAKHIMGDGYPLEDWPSIGDDPQLNLIDEEALTTATGIVVQTIATPFLKMAKRYIGEL